MKGEAIEPPRRIRIRGFGKGRIVNVYGPVQPESRRKIGRGCVFDA